MRVDATLTKDLEDTKGAAAALEAAGYDALWVGETRHDPFLQLLQAADATERISPGTPRAASCSASVRR
jgi:alkanesulfonate monooxygenase SsuD/methylene tetrahydromethanopterin reductase-like flavin-dependent oxidoreductase (luciferase family)